MDYQLIQPSSKLSQFVKCYWILKCEKISKPYSKQRVFPYGCVELMFCIKDRFLKIAPDNSSILLPRTIIIGQQKSYYDVKSTGEISIISVMFRPQGARMFFDLPICEIANQSIALEDIMKQKSQDLEEQLSNICDKREQIELIENFLTKRLIEKNIYNYNRISESIKIVNETKGEVSIKELTACSYLSTKQFERKFSDFVGVNPKQFLRIVRFQHTIFSQQINPSRNLTVLSYENGYYDQAHFSNEFKMLTGYTPKNYFSTYQPYSDYFSA